MQNQRPHQERITCVHRAKSLLLRHSDLANAFGREAPQPMGSGNHTKGAVRLVRIIKMESDREHLLQQLDGWLHMRNAFFDRPRTEALGICTRLNSDR